MAYRVTKTHTGHTWNAAYPDPVPSNVTEFGNLYVKELLLDPETIFVLFNTMVFISIL